MTSVKRLFDIAASAVGLVLLSPLFAVIAELVRIDSPGPILFRHTRVGRNGRTFDVYKFRTMRSDASGSGPELTVRDDARITRVGRILRHYKLDELPQLMNVLKGEMSLVGPRPEVPQSVDRWEDSTRRILLSIRPGMTDLASIEYCNEGALLDSRADPERAYLDEIAPAKNRLALFYVQNWSFWLDLKILYKTFAAILRQPGDARYGRAPAHDGTD